MAGARRVGRREWLDFVPASLWAALILALSTRPGEFFEPLSPAGSGLEKLVIEIVVHATQFSVFFLLVRWALGRQRVPAFAAAPLALTAVVGLSLLNESVQAFTVSRMFDAFDMAVDVTAGAAMAVATTAGHLRRQAT
jgi:hypothetical protein